MTVGEKIRQVRKDKGLTQKQLGALCDPKISESTIRKYELGLLNPKIETIRKIAAALNTDAYNFIFDDKANAMSEETIKRNFSTQLKFYMAMRGVSQSDLVKDLKLNSSTVSNWCNGVMFPRMDKIKMLAEYLNISMLDLMRDNSQEQEQKKELYYLNIIEPHLAGADLNEKDLEDICSFIDYVKTRKQQ